MDIGIENIKGVIFDFDGTIVISEHIHMEAWKDLSLRTSLPLPEGFLEDGVGKSDDSMASELEVAWLGVLSRQEILQQKREFYMHRCKTDCIAVPGVIKCIETLFRKGMPIAIATSSSREEIQPILDSFHLPQYFRAIWTVDDVTCAKPAPEIYQRASASLGLQPQECLAFEDSKIGVASARSAGCVLVTVQTLFDANTLGPAWFSIKDFNDPKLLNFMG